MQTALGSSMIRIPVLCRAFLLSFAKCPGQCLTVSLTESRKWSGSKQAFGMHNVYIVERSVFSEIVGVQWGKHHKGEKTGLVHVFIHLA